MKKKLKTFKYPAITLADQMDSAVFESIIKESAKSGAVTVDSIIETMNRSKNRWIFDENEIIVG